MNYIGNELELFQRATNWKKYFSKKISPFIQKEVLEVGAGIGGNIPFLMKSNVTRWVSLEPDQELCAQINKGNGNIDPRVGTLDDIVSDKFDTILYLDVLEHIEKDEEEFSKAVAKLKAGGHLVVLCPAHNFLFSPFDKAIGHFRRYNKKMFKSFKNENVRLKELFYLDSCGFFLSFMNSFFLKSSAPNTKQILFWDKVVIPISKIIDPILGFCMGKTVIGVWEKCDERHK